LSRLAFAPAALDDIDRLVAFLRDQSENLAAQTAPLLVEALSALKRHPLLGRPVELGLRELLISRGRSGYIALCRYDAARDTVLVLRLRHQREAAW
jgi:plasmid stabilization system protein ParE